MKLSIKDKVVLGIIVLSIVGLGYEAVNGITGLGISLDDVASALTGWMFK